MTITSDHIEPTVATKRKVSIALGFGISFLVLAAVSFIFDPVLAIVNYYSRVEYGSPIHEAFMKEADSVHLSAYLFNITNADRFLSGEDHKLRVQEVGPFTYQENRTNEDFEIDSEAQEIRYTPKYKVRFLPEESVGRPEDFDVVMPNIAFLSMASKVSLQNYFVKMGFNLLTSRLGSTPTVRMSAQDYLWGYDEPLIRLGNQFMPGWINFAKLGLLDRLYDNTTLYRTEVSSKEEEKFSIKAINHLGGLKAWGYEDPEKRSRCNSFKDVYEGIGYPPQMPLDQPIRIYRTILCRFFELEYQGPKAMEYGIDALQYKVSNKTYRTLPENDCLTGEGVSYDGVSDMSPCFYGLPVVLSNAHFWNTNPALYERVEGLTPSEEEHGSEFIIEPVMGMILVTRFSVQVSVLVRDVSFSPLVSKFSDMFVPVVSVKIVQPKLPEEQIETIKIVQIKLPYGVMILQLVLILLGLLCLSYAARILYWNWIYARQKGIGFELSTKEIRDTKEPLMKS